MFLINAFEPPRAFDLHTGEFVLVGRGEHCDIKLDDPSASRVHCRVIARDGRILLTDAGSRWGTFVNGERVEQAELRPGDRVRVGETLLTVSAESDAAATTIAPADAADEIPPEAIVTRLSGNANGVAVEPRDSERSSFLPLVRQGDGNAVARADTPAEYAAPATATPAAAPRLDTRPFVPARFLGSQFLRYQIESLIAHSRSGMSFIANDPALQRKVVLKFYRPDLLATEQSVARFLRAVRTMINFRHPNIIRLFDAGHADGLCYTITEHVDGVSGEQLIKNYGIAGMLDWQTTVQIGIDLCNALDELHEAGVVHRDIRPGHIVIENNTHRATIGELVLAKAWDREQVEQLTAAGDVVGDLAWQSPEQLGSGEPVDQRTDLYQLGLTLYMLLTGEQPFQTHGAASTVEAIMSREPKSPKSIQLSIPDLLADAVLRSLAKRPADRPLSAAAFLEELERVRKFATL